MAGFNGFPKERRNRYSTDVAVEDYGGIVRYLFSCFSSIQKDYRCIIYYSYEAIYFIPYFCLSYFS